MLLDLWLAWVVPFWQGALVKKGGEDITFLRSQSFVLKSVSCVTFFSEDWNRIFPRPLDEQYWKTWRTTQDFFCLGQKKRTRTEFTKNNMLSQRTVSYFFTTEAAEVKRAGGNEEIARFDRSDRSIVTWNILEQGSQSSPFKFPLLLAWLQRLDVLAVWTLSAKRV